MSAEVRGRTGRRGRSETAKSPHPDWETEVVYQIFPRSYRDSKGDHIGDLKGITSKLGFINDMGFTAILVNPIFAAREYHNYFADDFFRVDPTMGSNKDWVNLVRRAHSIGLKVILDVEIQYVADKHPWLASVLSNPNSPYKDYVWTKGSAFFGLNIHWAGGAKVEIAAINPDNPAVRKYADSILRYWAAPDGRKADGVDGFRIDHMMDDLDFKHVKSGMLKNFWSPIERDLRSFKPGILFLGEQANWQYGDDILDAGEADAAYAIPLQQAFVKFSKPAFEAALMKTREVTKPGKTQFVFIENHDLPRYASIVGSNSDLLRLGAVFNLTMRGTPMVYYGQELGMRGKQGNWNSDGNDIPVRLAYRWTRKLSDPGTADFYRGLDPWANTGYEKDDDGVSVQEESPNPDSLLNFYKKLITLRKRIPALREGSIELLKIEGNSATGYLRQTGRQCVAVLFNFSTTPVTVSMAEHPPQTDLMTNSPIANDKPTITLAPHGFRIITVAR